ncbi:MAG TPA: hypothetical protein VME69_12090 [Methylocella sp.]|nr:hypothetical protein [Methylocella sp.]
MRDFFAWHRQKAAWGGLCLWLGLTLLPQSALGQPTGSGGSPLDTILSTKLWADVPEARDFVRESRSPPDSLTYQPLTGVDPERPTPKSKAELEALESELEKAGAQNQGRAGLKPAVKKPVAKTARQLGQQ